jgi:hypothetical protein
MVFVFVGVVVDEVARFTTRSTGSTKIVAVWILLAVSVLVVVVVAGSGVDAIFIYKHTVITLKG